jgi:hypothetical protein
LSLSSALSILPSTIRGLDLNPSFSSAGAFKEGDRDGGELALFELCGVRLTHGWVVDAGEGKESEVMGRVGSYDAAQSLLVAADVGGKGFAEDGESTNALPWLVLLETTGRKDADLPYPCSL